MSSLIKIPLSISAYTMNMYNPDIIWATKSKKRQILHSLPFTFRGLLLPRLERQGHPIEGASKGFNSALKQFFMTSTLEIEEKKCRGYGVIWHFLMHGVIWGILIPSSAILWKGQEARATNFWRQEMLNPCIFILKMSWLVKTISMPFFLASFAFYIRWERWILNPFLKSRFTDDRDHNRDDHLNNHHHDLSNCARE